MTQPKPVTLADLRRAAPRGWIITESPDDERPYYVTAREPIAVVDADEVTVYAKKKQLARRAALAALRVIGGKP